MLFRSLQMIMKAAFSKEAISGGILGGGIQVAARYGIARGLFTNEAGIGSAAVFAATNEKEKPHIQGLISMTATFWDTVVMCTVTGLVIVTQILKDPLSIVGLSKGSLIELLQIPRCMRQF